MKQPSLFFFIAVFTTLFLGIFYFTVTLSAGLYIASELGGSQHISVYPMVFYGLGNCFSIPLSKYLFERYGPSKLLVGSLLVYTFFSFICGLAPTFFLFNLYRFGLGIGAGPFYLLSNRLLFRFTPKEKIGLYQTVAMLIYAITPVLGASFGAWLAYESHWKWIFHVNEPLSLFLAAYFWYALRKLPPFPIQKEKVFDGVGFCAFCLSILPLVTALTLAQEIDWFRSSLFCALLIVGIPSLIFFILWEIYHPHPILELRLFRNPTLSFSLINLGVLFSCYFGMIILIALWLNIYVNYTPLWIALILGTMAIAGLIGFILNLFWMDKLDCRVPLGLAILFFLLSCVYSTYFDVEINFFRIALARFLAGFGLVLFLVPLFRLCFHSCNEEEAPAAFTLFQTVRALCSSLGAGLYVILWQRRQIFFHERLGESITPSAPLTKSYFQKATQIFHLTEGQSTSELEVLLDKQATSLGLNDAFAFMALVLSLLFLFLIASFFIKKMQAGIRATTSPPVEAGESEPIFKGYSQ